MPPRPGSHRRRGSAGTVARGAVVALVAVAAVAACTEPIPDPAAGRGDDGADGLAVDADAASAVEALAGRPVTIGELPASPRAADEGAEPIRLGMINQDTGAIGAFPELTAAARAGVRFVNEELGGVDGRPVELLTCDTAFSPEGSTRCAQQLVSQGAVAVTGGIDIWGTSLPVLEANGIPYIGGIPVSEAELVSPVSFMFSGGMPGAFAGFVDYAVEELGAERIGIMYADFGSIKLAAETYGAGLAERLGVAPGDVTMVPFPVTEDDFVPHLTAVAAAEPDVIIAGVADSGCVPLMKGVADLGIDADLFLVGACAAPQILAAAGDAADGLYFNVEGPVSGEAATPEDEVLLHDNQLYAEVVHRYGDGVDAQSAGTVSFRSVMNIYSLMVELGADEVTPSALTGLLREARDRPSFAGHPYTCDGRAVPDLPALCAPQQVIATRVDGRFTQASEGWIDVPAVLADAAGGGPGSDSGSGSGGGGS